MKSLLLACAIMALLFLAPVPFLKSRVHRRSLAILALLTTGLGGLAVLLAEEHSRGINLLAYLGLVTMFWIAGKFEAK